MNKSISRLRNIGISAHIDSGKTTLTERILYYANRIHTVREVKGKDGKGATMDFMELEKERGITIGSAATNVQWNGHSVNIVDTPGHVDFTIEVERALRVLDGGILVLCSVGGVQSQSLTVYRQLKRYNIPYITFINKCDRVGANPDNVCAQIRDKLSGNPILLQMPIGLEKNFEGVIDLITMEAVYFEGESGKDVRKKEIPSSLLEEAKSKREEMLDSLSMFSDELAESFLEGTETPEQISGAIRKATLSLEATPVLIGSAYMNKGVQPLIDGVINYLPAPEEVENIAINVDDDEKEVKLKHDSDEPLAALAFKLEDTPHGQLTFIRIYQGKISSGDFIYNSRNRKKAKVSRIIKIHADKSEQIDEAGQGDIVALFGIDCASGDTFCGKDLNYSMTSMHIPEPVISLAINPKDKKSADNMSKALNKFSKEDPTFISYVDPESNDTIIKGMGELHLSIYIERMKREYKVDVEIGMPQVSYRETITKSVPFNYTHKKQTGGAGQFANVAGLIEPAHEENYEFVNEIKGGVIPTEYIPSCEKGFLACMDKGSLTGFPIVNIRVAINDGKYHPVDSSDQAFMAASIGAFRETYNKAKPVILEPIMKVSVESPIEFQGNIISSLTKRRGIIISTSENDAFIAIDAEVPLSEMFGYTTNLRSLTQGKAEFTMEFLKYKKVPSELSEKLIKEFQEKQ